MSESNEERSPGFKNTLIGKLVSASIFVAIGTGAVAYSMHYIRRGDSQKEVAESGDAQSRDEVPAANEPAKLRLQPVASDQTGGAMLPSQATQQEKTDAPAQSTSPPFSLRAARTGSSDGPAKENSPGGQFNASAARRVTTQRPTTGPPTPKSFSAPPTMSAGTGPTTKQDNNFGPPVSNSFGDDNSASENTVKPETVNQQFAKPPSVVPQNSFDGAAGPARIVPSFNENRNRTTDAPDPETNPSQRSTSPPPPNSTNESSFPPVTSSRQNQDNPVASTFEPDVPSTPSVAPRSNAFPSPPNSLIQPTDNRLAMDSGRDTSATSNDLPAPSGNISSLSPPTARAASRSNGLPDVPIQRRSGNLPPMSPVSFGRLTRPTPGERNLEGIQTPTLTIEKIAPAEIQVNQPADFQLVVRNVGRITANGVRVVDQVPAGTELIQAIPEPSQGPDNKVSWELDSLKPGQEKRIKIKLRPLQPGEIGSVAEVSFAAQASMRTKVTKPVLSIRHTAETRVLIGDPVVFDIEIRNDGDGAAADVIVQVDLPEGLQFSEGFRELEYSLGTLGPGQSKKAQLELKAAKIGKYRNVMVVQGEGGLQSQHAIDLEIIAPQLEASGDGPTRRYLRREATHNFAVRNTGTAQATNVELACRLPKGLKFVNANNRGQYDEATHTVFWSLAELNSGLVANVDVTTLPIEPGNQDLKLEVSADLEQTTEAICKLSVEHLVDVFFTFDDLVDPIEIGSATAYRLRIENQGTRTATNVQLSVQFPPGIQPTAVEGNITAEIRGQQIAFSPITSMNPGDEIEITIRGKGVTPGDHCVSVNLIADGREVNVSKQESTRVYSDR